MTSLADRTIAALRANHDELAALVPTLTRDQLTGPSGATEWTIADVLSHLGSGAEITLAGLLPALDGSAEPAEGFNQSVWDRWNALDPQAQAGGFLTGNALLVETFEGISPELRESLQLKLGFLPMPLSLAAFGGMRLNEATLHGWDIRVGVDDAATLDDAAAELLLQFLAGDLAFLVGFIGKADRLTSSAVVDLQGTGYGLVVGDSVALVAAPADVTATFTGGPEAAARLISGRLTPEHTPAGVEVTGDLTLDDLRQVFPGY